MSVVQPLYVQPGPTPPVLPEHTRWRLPLLCALLCVSIAFNVYLFLTAPALDHSTTFFVSIWQLSFLPYIAACVVVLVMKPQVGRRKWVELGLLLVGAVVLRVILLPVPPELSRDSWRYLWDARVTLHGYSPYVYAPDDPIFKSLQDTLYAYSRFLTVPTLYPPGAQAIYLLSYLLAPSNLLVLKSIFVGFDLLTCGMLAFLLNRKGLDMSRCIIYAWCPLPILEFAVQGHVDAATVACTFLVILCANAQWRGSRVLLGFLIAVATLTKLYPIILLLVVVRRRDWALLATCFATIVLAYVPYLILGHGQIVGFFGTYASERSANAGMVPLVVIWIGAQISLSRAIVQIVVYICDLVLMGGVSYIVLRLRWQERISMEAGMLVLIAAVFAVSTHIFPWYTAVFLPWITMLMRPLWVRRGVLNPASLAVMALWYFTCGTVLGYSFMHDWSNYYFIVYDVTLLALDIALVIGIIQYSEQWDLNNALSVKWLVDGASRLISRKHRKNRRVKL